MKLREQVFARQQQLERTDQPLRVDRPRGWITLAAFGVATIALLLFGFFGSLPQKVSVEAIVERAGDSVDVQNLKSGQVLKLSADAGSKVRVGSTVMTLVDAAGHTTAVTSPFAGTILQLFTEPGKVVDVGDDLYTMELASKHDAGVVAYGFLHPDEVSSVSPGMDVHVFVLSALAYGAARGTVVSISSTPATTKDVEDIVANDQLAPIFTRDSNPLIVTIKLHRDPSTPSGIDWYKGDGPPFQLTPDTPGIAEIHQGDRRPIQVALGI